MDFNASQMREEALIKEGRYKFRVLDAREKRSMAGNDMINLRLILTVGNKTVTYLDSLLLIPKMFWKVEHFCQATGMPEKIEEGRLMAQDCLLKEGYIDLVQKQDQQTGELINATKDYVKPENLKPSEQTEVEHFQDDDVPDFR